MNSLPMTINTDLITRLKAVGLRATAANFDDLLARASKQRWSMQQLLEEIARAESEERIARNLQRRIMMARLQNFRPIADFDWNWPKKIDRELINRALKLEFIPDHRNLILLGANGLGKTMIAKNIAYQAIQIGYTVIFKTASEILDDLNCDSPALRRKKLNLYGRVHLLCIDEVGYLSYDASAADLLYEVVNCRYEKGSLLITTNRAFKDWNAVFPHATSIATMLDRLLHHADVSMIDGQSYRVRESEAESAQRKKK